MEVTIKIEGMMCNGCSERVRKALERLPEVEKAVVSHEAGTAVVTAAADTDVSVLKNAVLNQGFDVID